MIRFAQKKLAWKMVSIHRAEMWSQSMKPRA